MQSLTPSAQEGVEGPQGVVEGVEVPATQEPLKLDAPIPALWAGTVSFLVIFFVVIMLIVRGRVVQPAKKKLAREEKNYFEPAGDAAEITFDNDVITAPIADEAVSPEQPEQTTRELEEPQLETVVAEPKKKKSAFSGLFSKKKETPPHTDDREIASDDAYDKDHGHRITGDLSDEVEDQQPARAEPQLSEPVREPQPVITPQPVASLSAHEETRIAHAEDAALHALKRAEEAETLARDLKQANDEAERVLMLNVQGKENELNERAAALSAMEEKLDRLSSEFQTRVDETPSVMPVAAASDDDLALSEAHFAEFADLLGEQFDTLRTNVNSSIQKLTSRIDQLQGLPTPTASHFSASAAARVQLTDLLADALPPQRYAMREKLATGRTADACIKLPGGKGMIGIDARFPVEAFDAWANARNHPDHAEPSQTELRRIVLRHIVDAAEKLIAPSETADCAMMFVPSEYILSEIHAQFPDLVQASYRANVWMVSPTSLMASLHTISAIMAGTKMREPDSADEELQSLRARIDALEDATGSDQGSGAQGTTVSVEPTSPSPLPRLKPKPTAVQSHPALHLGNPDVSAFGGGSSETSPKSKTPDSDKPNFPLS